MIFIQDPNINISIIKKGKIMDKNSLCGMEQGKFLMRGGDVSRDRDRDGKIMDKNSLCGMEQGKFLMRGGDVSRDRDRDVSRDRDRDAPSSTCPVTSLIMSTNALHNFS
uniref:Uncharacterized protein n=1 Tax=Opuntia streptacantha TaxID=393608 RepID=A0A7C9A707_OPUST